MPQFLLPNTKYDLNSEFFSGPNGTGNDLGPDTNSTLAYSLKSGGTSAGTISGNTLTTAASGADSVVATDGSLTGGFDFEVGTPASLGVTATLATS